MDKQERAERIAYRQFTNMRMGIPFDYEAILRHRKDSPDSFDGLPTDEECRKALGKNGHGK